MLQNFNYTFPDDIFMTDSHHIFLYKMTYVNIDTFMHNNLIDIKWWVPIYDISLRSKIIFTGRVLLACS